jgi:hypothetical protein
LKVADRILIRLIARSLGVRDMARYDWMEDQAAPAGPLRVWNSEKPLFSFPHEVVDHPALNAAEKRSILSRWASDACAVKSFPTLRLLPGTNFPVTFSAIIDALRQLDRRPETLDSTDGGGAQRCIIANFKQRKDFDRSPGQGGQS